MLSLPNYHIVSQIYESANSLVYRGHRKQDNQPVILKMLKQDYPTEAELTRYRQEYEITHDLDLVGVIKAYRLEKYQNTLVIIMEDFGGESLKQLMVERPFLVKEFLPLAILLSDSLGHIHTAHIIHKDINPSNIVVNVDTNQLKIIDFGIASLLARENPRLKNPEQLEGTLAYLSPEQTGRINRSIDYRTDLYSLGVTFYEMLTGILPFEAIDAMELVHCHIAKTPAPLCEVNSSIPPIVSDLVMKLMAKNAEDRYQSAFGVKTDLQECRFQFEKNAQIEFFQLAQNDFSGQLQIPQKLYGRENQINTLLQAFERVSQGTIEMMLVAGYSGVGKTALVHEVHKPMTARRGYFAAGKFDQFQKNIPYYAITQAFNEFCRYLLMENAQTLGFWQTKILDAVGNNGQIIIDVIPELELVIGAQPAVAKVGPNEAQNRFNLFFLSFVKALCDKEHPFILFIDDLQWIDSASLDLLKSIMLDDEMRHLLIIGAYRDNEVDSSHPFMMAIDELQTENAVISTIFLSNLQPIDVNRLLQQSLKCEEGQTQPLTNLIYQKTGGNAFFTHQFLLSLYSEALLHFDFEQYQWQWDIEKIAAQNITTNVVELMANKINQLPSKTSRVLQLAACIGNQFDLSMLAIINEPDQNETLSVLRPALAEGLIQPLDDNYKHLDIDKKSQFKFLHDRVQQAAYALIDDNQKQAVHLQIGRLLLENRPAYALEGQVFDIVGHFNRSLELVTHQAERLKVAKINLMAGQKAKMATAYGAAVNYFTKGRSLLTEKSWETEYELTLNLFTGAVEVTYLSGEVKQMAQLAQVVLQQARTLSDEVKVCEIQILAYAAQNQQPKAIKIALNFLNRLGISLPEEPTLDQAGAALQEKQTSLSARTIESLIDLPMMTNTHKILAMRVMAVVTTPAYHISPNLMILLLVKQVELSLNYGNHLESSFSYMGYGIILGGVIFDIESGYRFGKLALDLLERLGDVSIKAKNVFLFNGHIRLWKEHLRETLQPLLEGYYIGIETGDIEFAAISAYIYSYSCYFIGNPLATVEQKMAQNSHAIAQLKQENILGKNDVFWQAVLNLMGRSDNPCRLTGEVYDEKSQLERYQQVNDRTAIHYLHLNKCILHYLFQEYALAVENAEVAEHHLDGVTGLLVVAIFYFYESLARLAMYPSLPSLEQEAILTKVSANQEKMKLWAFHAPMNFQHKYFLIEAEKARVLDQLNAIEWYEKAIREANKNQYLHEEALAYELAAKFYLGRFMEKIAQTYMREAYYRYQQWGATAKLADLEAKYPQFLTAPEASRSVVSTTDTVMSSSTIQLQTSVVLDLDSVTKASQTLASEIILDKLLEKMMHIVIENAGAERGLLILEKKKGQSDWVIEAEGALNVDEVTLLQSIPIDGLMPTTMINYVVRSREPVVLANAMSEGIYTEDSYIRQHQLKSVLCSPILHQGQVIGLLYLENNLLESAFTPARVKVLEMLSSQAAISLENALLYRTLEQKVEQRTAQLAMANQEITLLNERLKQENLRMSAELDIAKQLQQMVLPKESEWQQIESLDIAGFMEPADEVGGDYYEVLSHDGHIKIGIGDVTGHGLESGVIMLMVQTTVRALLLAGINNPEAFLNVVNRTVYHNAQRMEIDKNLTLSLLDYQPGQLRITGQHEDVLVVRQGGQVVRVDTVDLGFMVGVLPNIAHTLCHLDIQLQVGDGIVLYTDGVTEARNYQMELYGAERLCEVVSRNWHLSAQEIQQAIKADVKQYIGTQKVYDDITLLVLKQK